MSLSDELKALMCIKPRTLEEAKKICETVEETLFAHPELEAEIKEYLLRGKMSLRIIHYKFVEF